jgi:hypothetical protein
VFGVLWSEWMRGGGRERRESLLGGDDDVCGGETDGCVWVRDVGWSRAKVMSDSFQSLTLPIRLIPLIEVQA